VSPSLTPESLSAPLVSPVAISKRLFASCSSFPDISCIISFIFFVTSASALSRISSSSVSGEGSVDVVVVEVEEDEEEDEKELEEGVVAVVVDDDDDNDVDVDVDRVDKGEEEERRLDWFSGACFSISASVPAGWKDRDVRCEKRRTR
jgi:hypothetical protein